MKRPLRLLLVSSLATLAACSGDDVRSTIGLERSAPDEFRVVSRPPLSVPPEFSLRPPLPGQDDVSGLPADKLTRSMITGTTADFSSAGTVLTRADGTPMVDTAILPVESGNAPSGAESELLTRLGADRKESDIRTKIIEDHVAKEQKKEDEWLNVDMFNPFAKEKDALDAKEEVKKLKDEGKPVLGKHLVQEEAKPVEKKEEPKAEEKPEVTNAVSPPKELPQEEPKAEAPKVEEKKTELRTKTEEPKPEAKPEVTNAVSPPKGFFAEEPKAEEPKAEEPKEETQEPKGKTLKDVLDMKASGTSEESFPMGEPLINLEMPDAPAATEEKPAEPVKEEEKKVEEKPAEPVKAEEKKEAPKAEEKKEEPKKEPEPVKSDTKMPSKIIVK